MENLESNNPQKESSSKFITITIGTVAICAVIVFSGIMYFKNSYLPKFLKENLRIEFTKSEISLLEKNVKLYDVKLKDPTEYGYSAKSVDIKVEEINFSDRNIQIEKIDVKELAGKNLKELEENMSKQVGYSVKDLEKGIGALFSGVDIQKKSEYINEGKMDTSISENLLPVVKDSIKEQVEKVKMELTDLKKWMENKNKANQKGSFSIKNLTTTYKTENNEYEIVLENLQSPTKSGDKPINIKIKDKIGNFTLDGSLFIQDEKLETSVSYKDFNYLIISNIEKYITSGKFSIRQKNTLENGKVKIEGSSYGSEVKFNIDAIISDIAKDAQYKMSPVRAQKLKDVISKIDEIIIYYTYDQATDTLTIETNLKKQINEILKNQGDNLQVTN